MSRKYLMVGNWKMNQSLQEIRTFFSELNTKGIKYDCDMKIGIAPQSLHLSTCLENLGTTEIQIGSQNCSEFESGAYTGELAPGALKELGCGFTLIGHSERRSLFGENDHIINAKVANALSTGLDVILCCGETLEERESGKTLEVVLGQLENALIKGEKKISFTGNQLTIAYEPVWAIGTGKTASPEQAEEVHVAIRNFLKEHYGDNGSEIYILYGGSVKPANVKELLAQPNIDGGLVGGASLKADSFAQLCTATK
jgi:triosephosphate isomerase